MYLKEKLAFLKQSITLIIFEMVYLLSWKAYGICKTEHSIQRNQILLSRLVNANLIVLSLFPILY